MAKKASFMNSSILGKVSFFLLIISLLLHIVGFSTTYWFSLTSSGRTVLHLGIWSACYASDAGEIDCTAYSDVESALIPASVKTAGPLEAVSLAALISSCIVSGLDLFVIPDQMVVYFTMIVSALLGGILGVAGEIVFGTNDGTTNRVTPTGSAGKDWSFGLSVAGSSLAIFVGLLFILDKLMNRNRVNRFSILA